MSLVDLLLESTLGNKRAPDTLDVALFLGAREVTDSGYKRASVANGGWQLTRGAAETTVRFGPFYATTQFDRVRLYRGSNEVVEEQSMSGPLTAPPQMVYEHTYVVSLVKE